MRRIDVAERRARLGRRHRLAAGSRAGDVVKVAESMVALHGTDAASVYLAAWARMFAGEIASIESALYEERALVRILGMRRTMFVVPVALAPIVQAACTQSIATRERANLLKLLAQTGIAKNPEKWLAEVEESTLRALAARGEATATELSQDEPRLKAQFRFGEGKKWGGTQSAATRVLFQMAAEGRIIRGRPRGSWISTQYRWAPTDAWLPGGLAPWPPEEARTELARRWLRAFGPGTAADLRWWTGWAAVYVKKVLAEIGPVEVDLDGATGLVLPDDVDKVTALKPWVALLPALDPTVMGWKGREWFLGEHGPALFDRSGNAGPTVWCDGRIVGGWAQRAEGTIAFRLLEDIGSEARAAVGAEAERLGAWLGPVRITPRFRTPLEKELSA